MIAPIDKVRGEGNCGWARNRGEEACECVRKDRSDFAAGRTLTKAARLRTGTSYKAGAGTGDGQCRGEVRPSVQATYPRDHRPQPGHLHGTPPERTAKLRSRLDGLLRAGVIVEAVRQARSVDTTSNPDVLLEAVASAQASTRNAHSARRSQASGDPPCTQPPELLAHVQDNCQRRRADQCVAGRTRTAQPEDTMGQACSTSLNRRMRTRTSGGVGRVTGNGGPYPIMRPRGVDS